MVISSDCESGEGDWQDVEGTRVDVKATREAELLV